MAESAHSTQRHPTLLQPTQRSPRSDEMHGHVAGGEGLPHAVRQPLLRDCQLREIEEWRALAHVQQPPAQLPQARRLRGEVVDGVLVVSRCKV